MIFFRIFIPFVAICAVLIIGGCGNKPAQVSITAPTTENSSVTPEVKSANSNGETKQNVAAANEPLVTPDKTSKNQEENSKPITNPKTAEESFEMVKREIRENKMKLIQDNNNAGNPTIDIGYSTDAIVSLKEVDKGKDDQGQGTLSVGIKVSTVSKEITFDESHFSLRSNTLNGVYRPLYVHADKLKLAGSFPGQISYMVSVAFVYRGNDDPKTLTVQIGGEKIELNVE